METFERADLAPVLDSHKGNQIFADMLDRTAGDPAKLLILLARYTQFNSVFGGGVANLAGEIAVRQELFRDTTDPLEITRDRSVEVASKFFFAAIDEFDDRGTIQMDTHRTLAQATLKGAGQFFGYDPKALNEIISINWDTKVAMDSVHTGYSVGQVVGEHDLFRSMGFHMGSEILADEEFRQLDGFLRIQYPELVSYLENTKLKINGVEHVCYQWVRIHTTVEADHFAYAVAGSQAALEYYVGSSPQLVKRWVLEGFQRFASVHEDFMSGLDGEDFVDTPEA